MNRKTIPKSIAIALVLLIGLSAVFVPSAFAVTSLYNGNLEPVVTKEEVFKPITQQTKTTRTEATSEVLGLADMGTANNGAHLRLPVVVQKLEKQTYGADEDVMITVANPEGEDIDTAVLDDEGKEVAVMVEQLDKETTSELHISATNQFKPGKYTVVVTDAEGKQTKQDFTWGVLAFNTDKATYLPKEKATISMAVLDDKGAMVCDADVTLEITNPTNNVTTLTTKDGKIVVNPGCKFTEFTLKPDYEATYTVDDAGAYRVKLTAKTEKGTYTITDAFDVKDQTAFDIKRTSATRIYPPTEYPMNIEITANRDFTGVITETVPESFTITPSDGHNSYDDMDTVYLQGTDPGERLERKVLSASHSLLEMPFDGTYTISQGFGHELTDLPLKEFYSDNGLAGHDGIDFALPMGTPLFAVDEGVVLEAGDGDYGITVIIQHVWGRSYYGHLSKTTMSKGMKISKGSHIGYSGNTGESTGPHLHFGIKPNTPDMNNGYSGKIDPLPLLPKDENLATRKSLDLDQGGVLSATDSAAIQVDASPTPTITPSQTPEMPVEPSVAMPMAVTASESAESDFAVIEEEIKEEVKDTENPVHERVKVIQWNVSLKKGEKTTLSYMYKAPLVSPQFYTVGPLKFFEGKSQDVVFEESRKWQIAADAIGVGWYDYYWLYRKEIVIDNANVPATQTNFPVLVQITADAELAANAQADGDDILFTDATGKTKLDHEVESYSAGTLRVWVEVPSLSSAADTSIYMYYGNSVVAAQQNVSGTWSNSFVGVWHFDDNPSVASCSGGTKELCDSTGNANHGNMNGAMTAGQEVPGKIGNSWDFISADYAVVTDSVTLDTLNADMTITTWLNSDVITDSQYRRVISRGSPQFWFVELDGGGDNGAFLIDLGVDTCSCTVTNITIGTWYYLYASTQDSPSSSLYYLNNVLQKNDPDGGAISTTGDIGIAAESGGTTPWDGKLDEMRLANVQRTANWALTEYNNQNNPAGFISVSGTQETKGYAASPDQLMRHGKFFDSSFTEQPFIF